MWRLLVLVAIGFGVGLLFGVVTEEPELLAGHLRGESQSVALDVAPDRSARSADREDSAEAIAMQDRPALGTQQTASAVQLPAVASPRSAPKAFPSVVVAPAGGSEGPATAVSESVMRVTRAESGWSIQVGAFSQQAAATRLAEGLRARYPVEVLPASGKAGRWRVRVQPIRSEARARQMAEQLKRDERLPTWVTPMEGRSGS
jgi:cell division protein FtsN